MKPTRALAIFVIAASLGLGASVKAQSLKNVSTPNEFPPSSYKGKQYVDSKGCVYVRAGVDGNVTWVPRMSRSRKVICGYKPTLENASRSTSSASKIDNNTVMIQPAAKPTQSPSLFGIPGTSTATAAKPATKPKATSTTKAAAKPKTTTKTASKPAPVAKPKTTAKPKPTPVPVKTTAPKPTTKTTTKTTTTAPKTTAPKTTSTKATAPRRTLDPVPCSQAQRNASVRCGPQGVLPYTPGTGRPTKAAPKIIYRRQGASSRHTTETPYPRVGTVVRRGEVAQNVRVVPRHVYEARGPVEAPYKVPAGFTRVFEDGRLNPHRAEMTFAGMAASDTILERDVPRTLINRRTGEAYVVSSKSSVPYSNPPVVSSRNSGGLNTAAPVVSSRSVPVEKTLILAQRTYVHVETYSNGDAAQKAAKQMQRLGLPAKIGKYNASGQTRRMVLVGPFMNTADAGHALTKAQKAGYSRASIRN